MKHILVTTVIVSSLLLSGCFGVLPVKKEVVQVAKPVLVIPKPPEVPAAEWEVDKLTIDDAKDPGKIGQAYKHDMLEARQLLKIYQMIVDGYKTSSQTFDQVNKEIDQLYKDIPAMTKTK